MQCNSRANRAILVMIRYNSGNDVTELQHFRGDYRRATCSYFFNDYQRVRRVEVVRPWGFEAKTQQIPTFGRRQAHGTGLSWGIVLRSGCPLFVERTRRQLQLMYDVARYIRVCRGNTFDSLQRRLHRRRPCCSRPGSRRQGQAAAFDIRMFAVRSARRPMPASCAAMMPAIWRGIPSRRSPL